MKMKRMNRSISLDNPLLYKFSECSGPVERDFKPYISPILLNFARISIHTLVIRNAETVMLQCFTDMTNVNLLVWNGCFGGRKVLDVIDM